MTFRWMIPTTDPGKFSQGGDTVANHTLAREELERIMTYPAKFRDKLLIDADDGAKLFGPNLDPFQRDDFAAIDPALRRVVGQDVEANQRIYLERPRGHSKTTDIGVCASWLLFASRRKLNGACCAADWDQATLILEAIATLIRMNPWLASVLEVQKNKVTNLHTGSTLTVMSSDAASSYGLLLDFAICDELTHWKSRDLWDSIFSTTAKRKHCLLLVISNAGFTESWQGKLRNQIVDDPSWTFRRLNGPVASWIDAALLDLQKKYLPTKSYLRLWENCWSDGSGDALESADIDAAVTLNGPLAGPERGWQYVGGLDIGLKRNASAWAVVAKHVGFMDRTVRKARKLYGTHAALADLGFLDAPEDEIQYTRTPGTGQLKLVELLIWKPSDGRVELDAIERAILDAHRRFKLTRMAYDPWQAEHLGQRLTKAGLYCDAMNFTQSNKQSMASGMLTAFRERQLSLYDHPELIADLKAMRIVEKASGAYVLDMATNTEDGTHGDAATSLAIALESSRAIRSDSTLHANRRLVYN